MCSAGLRSPNLAPSTLHFFTVVPGEDGTGGTEVSGTGYARQSVTLTTSASATTNSGAVEFPTAVPAWGNLLLLQPYTMRRAAEICLPLTT